MVQAHVSYLRTGTNVSMAKRGSTELHDLLNVVTGWTFDLAYSRTKLNRGHIAPLGKQKAYHIYRTMVNGNNNLYKNKQLIDNQLFGGIDAKHTIYGIGYSVTYNKVIKDQFLLTYGWRMNLSSPHLWFRLLGEDPSYDELHTTDYKLANLNRFKTAVTNKFFISDMLQFKIGFGILR
jgi:hypothetical protein